MFHQLHNFQFILTAILLCVNVRPIISYNLFYMLYYRSIFLSVLLNLKKICILMKFGIELFKQPNG
jgi:hypothetical protein